MKNNADTCAPERMVTVSNLIDFILNLFRLLLKFVSWTFLVLSVGALVSIKIPIISDINPSLSLGISMAIIIGLIFLKNEKTDRAYLGALLFAYTMLYGTIFITNLILWSIGFGQQELMIGQKTIIFASLILMNGLYYFLSFQK